MDNVEDGDLVHVGEEEKEKEVSKDAYSVMAYWNWERSNYFIKQ